MNNSQRGDLDDFRGFQAIDELLHLEAMWVVRWESSQAGNLPYKLTGHLSRISDREIGVCIAAIARSACGAMYTVFANTIAEITWKNIAHFEVLDY